MVLQHSKPNKIWGFDALDEVGASLECTSKSGSGLSEKLMGKLSEDGLWMVELPLRSASSLCTLEERFDCL